MVDFVVVISDLHCGSSVGLMPPVFDRVDEGPALRQNKPQRWLWRCWEDFWGKWMPSVVGKGKWALVINGDLVEGCHHRNVQIHPDVIVHKRIAEDVLIPVSSGSEATYVIKGTECHTGNIEGSIGTTLAAEHNDMTGVPSFDHLLLNVNGYRLSFQHHIGTSSRPWLGGYQMLASLVEEQFRASSRGNKAPDVIVRSHRHVYGSMDTLHGKCVVTPAWQLLTRYGRKVTGDMLSSVGGIILDCRKSEDGPIVRRRVYQMKPSKEISV